MKKITDLKEKRFRTVEEKDAKGRRTRSQVEYWAPLAVREATNQKRLVNYLVDKVIIMAAAYCIRVALDGGALHPEFSRITITLFSFDTYSLIFYPGYYILFEYLLQATPGKLITGTRVIGIDGKRPRFDMIVARSFIRLIPFEPLSFFGVRGWHDNWTDTWVVSKAEEERINRLMDEQSGVIAE